VRRSTMGMDDDVSWVKIKTTTTDDPNAPNSSRKSGYLKGVPHNSEAWNSTMSNEDPVKKGKKNQFGTEEFGPFNGGVITDYICTAIFKLGMHPSDGSRWSVEKCGQQLRDAIILDTIIFVANEIFAAMVMWYWRPIAWIVGWIVVQIIVSGIGLVAYSTRNEYLIVMFAVLQVMFSVVNLSHAVQQHGEAVRACKTEQFFYKNCEVPGLFHCIYNSTCVVAEMAAVRPKCHAPGHLQCDVFAAVDMTFVFNLVINFFTYAEPTFWATMFFLRLSITTMDPWKAEASAYEDDGCEGSCFSSKTDKAPLDHHFPRTTAFARLKGLTMDTATKAPEQNLNYVGPVVMLIAWFCNLCMTIWLQTGLSEEAGTGADLLLTQTSL